MLGFIRPEFRSLSGDRSIKRSVMSLCHRPLLLLLLSLLVSSIYATGALSGYVFRSEIGVYQEITDGLVFGDSSTDNQRFVSANSPSGGTSPTGQGIPIGFDFVFSGVTYDRLAINANGWISLGRSDLNPAVNMTSTNYIHPLASIPTNDTGILIARIAAFAGDLQGQATASIQLKTIGNAPDRICIIQWRHYRINNGAGNSLNFQIRLHETTNVVRIVYGLFTYPQTQTERPVQVGLRGFPSTIASNFCVRRSDTGHSAAWQNTDPATIAGATIRFRWSSKPANGLNFIFSPPFSSTPPQPVTNLHISLGSSGATLQWDALPNTDYYHIYSTDDPFGVHWDFEGSVVGPSWAISSDHPRRFFRVISVRLD